MLGIVGSFGPQSAGALEGHTTDVNITTASAAEGLTLDIEGTGYIDLPNAATTAPAAGVYAALRDPATMTDAAINADTNIVPAVKFIWKGSIASGAWSTTLEVPAAELNPDAAWEVIVWVAHGGITPLTLLDTIPLNLTDSQKQELFPEWSPPTTTSTTTTTIPPTTAPSTTTSTTLASSPTTTATNAAQRCVTETVPGSAGTPQLAWGIRSSFVSYVGNRLPDGNVETGNGVTQSGDVFTWTNGTGEVSSAGQGTWSFNGFVRFTGHGGVLDTSISNPRIQLDGSGGGALIVDVRSKDMNGVDVSGNGMIFAQLRFTSLSSTGGTATTTLTADGSRALNSMYPAGEAMDPLTVSVHGGSSASTVERCYDTQGNLVSTSPGSSVKAATTAVVSGNSLPATGFGALQMTALGLGLVAAGMAAVGLTTRRRQESVTESEF